MREISDRSLNSKSSVIQFLFTVIIISLFCSAAYSRPLQVYLLSGQSNMVGYVESTELPAEFQVIQGDVRVYFEGSWGYLRPNLGKEGYCFGPEITFGRDMADTFTEDNIALIKRAWAGTDLYEEWRPPLAGGTTGPLYIDFIDTVNTALASIGEDYEVAGMIWMQGETDAKDNLTWAQAYEDNLTDFIASIRQDLNIPDLPFVIGQIKDSPKWEYGDIVMQAQYNVSQTVPYTSLVVTNDLELLSDLSHYIAEDVLELGYRFVNASNLLTDPDSDIIINSQDNCPNTYNPDQTDIDADGIGDTCDSYVDYCVPVVPSLYEIAAGWLSEDSENCMDRKLETDGRVNFIDYAVYTANRPPTAVNDSASVANCGGSVTIAVLANDSDPEGDEITVTGVSAPTAGTAVINGSNVIYTSPDDFEGTAAFTYTVTDAIGAAASAQVTVVTLGCGQAVLYWNLNETSGTLAADSSGNNNHGRTVNMTDSNWDSGYGRACLNFNGSDEHVKLDSGSLSQSISGDLTVAFWTRFDRVGSDDRFMDLAQASGEGLQLAVDPDGGVRIDNEGGVTNPVHSSSNALSGTWHHIAAVRTGSTVKLYVDGNYQASGTTAVNTYTRFFAGSRSSSKNYLNGRLDEMRIYDSALSDGQISELMNY